MTAGPLTYRKFGGRTTWRFIVIAAVLLGIAILAIAGWRYHAASQKAAAERVMQQKELNAQALAVELAKPFDEINSRLRKLSKDEIIITAFELGNKEALQELASTYEEQFEFALKLRFLLADENEYDDLSYPPLSYASLEKLREAKQLNRTIRADVLMFDTPDQHIVIVQRVINSAGRVVGMIHLSLDVVLFEQLLSNISLMPDTYLELRQSTQGKDLLLDKSGDARVRVGEPIMMDINGTSWSIAYWQELAVDSGLDIGSWSNLPLLPGVIILILIVGAIVLVSRYTAMMHRGNGQQQPGVVYAGAVKAILEGTHPGIEMLDPGQLKRDRNTPINPLSQGMAGEDITLIMSAEELKKALAEEEIFDITFDGTADSSPGSAAPSASLSGKLEIAPGIFRAYDIRGIVGKELNTDVINYIGRAIGTEAAVRGQQEVIVGRDGRNSSPELAAALIAGLNSSGRDVIDIGMVPTPVLYFATHFLESNSGVMLTGSHNGPEYNGLKIVLAGETLSEEAIQSIYKRIVNNDLESGQGSLRPTEVVTEYIHRITEDVPVSLGGAFKIVVDCGNGVAGALAPQLYRAMGHNVIELFCEVDGNFPNHHPDPSQPENMQAMIDRVKKEGADLGFAFDGDADRLGVVDGEGNIIWPDRQLMLLAKDVLSRNQGAEIIFDVKCSRHLNSIIESAGGRPLMWRTGHSLIKSKMKEVNAPLAGEMSGHIFFKERWYGFDDALYTGARLLEILVNSKASPVEVFADLPQGVSTPELRIDLTEEAHQTFMNDLRKHMNFDGAKILEIDGFRVEFEDGWGLVRPSNTSPCLVLRFEADNQQALDRIQNEFRAIFLSINPDLQLPF